MTRVLVIDDHPATCQLIEHICKLQGVECMTTLTAEEGIPVAQEFKPSLIFLDLMLPGEISGWQAITLLKNDVSLKDTTIIAITAGDHQQTAMEADSDGYLRKPFTVQQITNLLQQYL
jgi:CheY-like chemotaxis protein